MSEILTDEFVKRLIAELTKIQDFQKEQESSSIENRLVNIHSDQLIEN